MTELVENHQAVMAAAVDRLWASVTNIVGETNVLKHEIDYKLWDNVKDDYLQVIPEDGNRKLYIELSFLEVVSTIEGTWAKDKTTNKLQLHCILIDYSIYMVFQGEAQYDLSFILISKILGSNTIEFCSEFWDYIESREHSLVSFLTPESYPTNIKCAHSVYHKNLVARRRPGSLLLKTLNQLITRMEHARENVANDSTVFLGKLYFYFARNFSINDDMLVGNNFEFNENFLRKFESVPKLPAKVLHYRFWQVKAWLQSPLNSKFQESKYNYLLNDMYTVAKEYSKSFPSRRRRFRDSLSKKLPRPLKEYLKTRDVSQVSDLYYQKFIQAKLKYFESDDPAKYSSISPLTSIDCFDRLRLDDTRNKIATLIQIGSVASFVTNLSDRRRSLVFQDLIKFYENFNGSLKESEKLSAVPIGSFRAAYSEISNYKQTDIDNLLLIKKTTDSFFSDHSKLLSKIISHIKQSETIWFYWKLQEHKVFNVLPDDSYKKGEITSSGYDATFGIKFGSRNLTKVLGSKHSLESEPAVVSQGEGDLKELRSKLTPDEFVTEAWKVARFGGGSFEDPSLYTLDEDLVMKETVDPNAGLRLELKQLENENKQLEEELEKKLETEYVSVNPEKEEDMEEEKPKTTEDEENLDY